MMRLRLTLTLALGWLAMATATETRIYTTLPSDITEVDIIIAGGKCSHVLTYTICTKAQIVM